MVGDGNGRVSPGLRPLDHVLIRAKLGPHAGKGVHSGHCGVEVELHPLLGGGVLLHFLLRSGDGHRLQHHVAVKSVHVQTALDLDAHPLFDAVYQGLALLPGKKLVHPDRAGVVGHVEGHHPGPPLFQLPVVDGEDIPLHHHHAHVQLQLTNRGRGFCDGFAKNGLSSGLLVSLDRGGNAGTFLQGRPADGLSAGKGIVNCFFFAVYIPKPPVFQRFQFFRPLFVSYIFFLVYNLFLHVGRRLNLHAVQTVGPTQRLLRLDDQVGAGSGGPLHHDLGAAAVFVDGGGQNEPALHSVGQLGPLAQGGKHL